MRGKWLHFCEDCQQEITRGKLWNRDLFPKTHHAIWYFLHAAILKTRHTGNGDTSWTFFYLRHRHHQWHHVLNTHGHLLDLTCLHCTELASAAQSWWKPSGPYPECKRINEFCHSVHVLAIMLCYVILCYVSHLGYHPSSLFSLLTMPTFQPWMSQVTLLSYIYVISMMQTPGVLWRAVLTEVHCNWTRKVMETSMETSGLHNGLRSLLGMLRSWAKVIVLFRKCVLKRGQVPSEHV